MNTEKHAIQAAKQKKPTGKELFEADATLTTSDIAVLEHDAPLDLSVLDIADQAREETDE